MSGTINVPGLGPTKTVYVVAGVGVVGGVLVYAYWKRSQTAAADAAAATAPAVVDSSGSDGYTEDSTAAGYNTVYPTAYYPGVPASSSSDNTYTTNEEWAVAAESDLESDSLPLATVTLAISRVLGGLSVTSSQRDIFMQAVGLLGDPPNGYPTPIKLTDSGTGSSPTPGGPLPAPTGLRVTSTTKTTVGLAWNKVTGATHYRVYRSDVATNVGDASEAADRIGGLRSNTTYHFHVRALDANNTLGAASGTVSARTKK